MLLGTILYKAVLLIAMLWLPAVFLKLTMAALFVAALLTDRIGKKKGALFMAEETKRGGAPQEALLELRHIPQRCSTPAPSAKWKSFMISP